MPYAQRSPRQLRQHVITYQDVCRANQQVTKELIAAGFWHDRLEDVDVYWTTHSLVCYGWYEGDIHIPAVSGAQLSDLIMGKHTRLTDILRHEWAHAVADKWPEVIQSRRFIRAFGAPYESMESIREYHPRHHLTPYASTSSCEDFAETFHFYLRHKGRLPMRLADEAKMVRKWRFVEWLACRISRHQPDARRVG
jgi:hypothetical protein